jgi:very-short-patch-repair endonuclease
MRSELTYSEQKLWRAIRGRRLGVAFRRQVVLGHFIADFVAFEARLVVEVDGGYHARRGAADARRDRALERLGYRVLRLDAELVEQHRCEAIARIRAALAP